MLKYKHILVALDFSPHAEQILKKAFEFSQSMHATLSLLHVVEPLPSYGYAFLGAAEIETELRDQAIKKITSLGKKFEITPKYLHTRGGFPKTEIILLAEEIKADLIIIGSHGHHGLINLLGSTANAIIHQANCDVLTIRIK